MRINSELLFALFIRVIIGQSSSTLFSQLNSVSSPNISPSQIIFLDTISNPQQPGVAGVRFDQSPRITSQNLRDIDWTQIDRRSEEGWWHLYPFGERYFDRELSHRPWMDKQIDLDFFFPYYGFRFNYTFIFHEGFIAFSHPWYIQPPYTYPNPRWPNQPDPSLIAAFMADQQIQYVGDERISNVWFRIIERPPNLIGYDNLQTDFLSYQSESTVIRQPLGIYSHEDARLYRTYRGQQLKTVEGRLEDPEMLDQITRDIRDGMVGARGWKADYALVITWERMSYGGAPKITELNQYEQAKRWQNTYQLVIATDEIRSYAMLNYAHINWTSSSQSGALTGGRGGKQSALVGFNGGNGTGFYQLPYSADGNSYKLVEFGSTQTAGRWLARVDETIQYGGCNNDSRGNIEISQQYGTMLGGFALNISGPCFRLTDILKLQIDELTIDCERIDMAIGRCVVPINAIFKTGMVDVQLSVDGGKNYPWWTKFYILQPGLARRRVNLMNDPLDAINNWNSYAARNLSLTWDHQNISIDANALVDITLWGYWEDVEGHSFRQIGYLARRHVNNGIFVFDPQSMIVDGNTETDVDAWRWYYGGVVQVRVSDSWRTDRGDGINWSGPISFGWYFYQRWLYEYGNDWAMHICLEWFDYDGRRDNFQLFLEPKIPCPCTLNQAQMDFGRFTGLPECDNTGDHRCYYTQGAQHCVISTVSVWTGAGQMCCYDYDGWLMFSDDYEYNNQYLRFYSAGVPYRAHPWGSFPYKRPPYVPTMSNFYNDLLPYDYCCKWAGHCEFFFWRRQTSTCQMYRPPSIGYVYGQSHFVTYDGTKYTFNGKGYYILSMMKSPRHDLMVQTRMEQPPNTPCVTLRSPPRNMNMSEIDVMFTTGVGIRVHESNGLLSVMVSLPNNYNETDKNQLYNSDYDDDEYDENWRIESTTINSNTMFSRCATHYRTLGLFGTFNGYRLDDLTSPDCTSIPHSIGYPQTPNEARQIYYDFGERWRLDRNLQYPSLFQSEHKPIYNPLNFANPNYQPVFDRWQFSNVSLWESLIFTRDEVRITCQGSPTCEFDYIQTGRREIALDTLDTEKKLQGFKREGEIVLQSCGPLVKSIGVIKHPPGNNYLDGVTVTFTCKPEYFLHGDQQRTCTNGKWSPGWWVWCRDRSEEIALKWMTAIMSSIAIIIAIVLVFVAFYIVGKKKRQELHDRIKSSRRASKRIHDPISPMMANIAIHRQHPIEMTTI